MHCRYNPDKYFQGPYFRLTLKILLYTGREHGQTDVCVLHFKALDEIVAERTVVVFPSTSMTNRVGDMPHAVPVWQLRFAFTITFLVFNIWTTSTACSALCWWVELHLLNCLISTKIRPNVPLSNNSYLRRINTLHKQLEYKYVVSH